MTLTQFLLENELDFEIVWSVARNTILAYKKMQNDSSAELIGTLAESYYETYREITTCDHDDSIIQAVAERINIQFGTDVTRSPEYPTPEYALGIGIAKTAIAQADIDLDYLNSLVYERTIENIRNTNSPLGYTVASSWVQSDKAQRKGIPCELEYPISHISVGTVAKAVDGTILADELSIADYVKIAETIAQTERKVERNDFGDLSLLYAKQLVNSRNL